MNSKTNDVCTPPETSLVGGEQIKPVIGCAISKKPFEITVTGEGFENRFIIKKESDLKDVYDIIELLKYKLREYYEKN